MKRSLAQRGTSGAAPRLHETRVMKHACAQARVRYPQKIRSFGGGFALGCCALLACGGRTLEQLPESAPQTARGQAAAPVAPDLVVHPTQATPDPGSEPNYQPDVPSVEQQPPPAPDYGTGAGGGTATPPECPDTKDPSSEWSPTEWVAYRSATSADPYPIGTALQDARKAMWGSWHGIADTPWTKPYAVDLTFTADGHYSSRCSDSSPSCCLAFYYGTDDETPLKQWRIDSATASGAASGQIDIPFDDNPYSAEGDTYSLPAWQGVLSNIERDASGDGLRFDFARSDGYGPVHYDLRRVK